MPEPPGMRMSDTSTCGSSSSIAASTSRGLVKLRTARSSRASAFSSTNRMDWSSSTIQMGFMPCLWLGPLTRTFDSGQRYHDLEKCLARLTHAFNHALVLLHESLRQCEPQARPTIAPRYQGVKNAISDRLGD